MAVAVPVLAVLAVAVAMRCASLACCAWYMYAMRCALRVRIHSVTHYDVARSGKHLVSFRCADGCALVSLCSGQMVVNGFKT